MKMLRSILGLVVGMIIMLHTLVPHKHYESSSEVQILSHATCSVSLFMELQLSLGLNHGDGHFEQYVEFDSSPDSFILALSELPGEPYFTPKAISLASKVVSLKGFVDLDRLRGPPSC